jgi:DNA-binding transcriptional ArsR family regulator
VAADLDETLRALAHPVRREILELVRSSELPAGAIVDAVGLAPASVSEHLKVLRKTGLVVMSASGTWRRYRADPAALRLVAEWVERQSGR